MRKLKEAKSAYIDEIAVKCLIMVRFWLTIDIEVVSQSVGWEYSSEGLKESIDDTRK